MSEQRRHPRTLEETERDRLPLPERDHAPRPWRRRAAGGRKRMGRETGVRVEKTTATFLREAHERQGEEAMDALAEGYHRSSLG